MTNTKFTVPQREDVSANNQVIFDNLKKAIGFVPNLYATIAYSDTALESYLNFQNSKTSLSKKEKEAVNLVVSQVNNCAYCLSAHTVLGKMNGFTEEQTIEIRKGTASFDNKLNALVTFTKEATINKGKVSETILNNFLGAGYSNASIIDVIAAIADKVIMNYIHNLTQVPIDFPLASSLN
ncbi:carboxymuconolactone decarboxylase family protein [Taibaiella lutea]|uniref:Carboxymuconolactone decarboxylase family protein n=1 Tax=Taibaiella lutea TaxID=2608001 RepID=A0A5M6CP67_9BACT|nr:carboxymuconolactone decarboxylase family protein [Taibaiella lutea]KAA5535035.1 carboxymuconolactone decarboxylase family protein [Taibaiella lutea]